MEKDNLTPEKLNLESLDIVDDIKSKLRQLFPSAFIETVDENGTTVESIDFEKLKTEIGEFSDIYEGRKERYGMDWPGKREGMKLIQQPSSATLKPCREESINFDTTENLFIEGDNLEVLKLLQKSYYGKIKMIYIDPPYNTGKEFIYQDNYRDNLQNYLELTGQVDGEGKKLSVNTETNGRYHTNWLNMMFPRLYLARNLLSMDGIILISIDYNEISNLRKLLDEMFGEERFVAQLTIESDSRARQYGSIATTHEYLLIYSKNQEYNHNILSEKEKTFQYQDKEGGFDVYELRNRNIAFNINNRPNLYYPFWVNPNSQNEDGFYQIALNEVEGWVKTFPQESQGIKTVWRWGKEKASKNLNTTLVARKHGAGFYQIVKKYRGNTFVYNSVWVDKEIKTDKGTLEIKALFDNKKVFDFPKPIELIKRALNIFSDDDSIILDFFSGSATTAHAVMQLNAEDGDNRKFIMVQLPEKAAEDSEAYKAGYKNISEIGKERIRRVIKKIKEEKKNKSADLFKEEGSEQDLGFKVFKLDYSNFKIWEKPDADTPEEELKKQIELQVDYIGDKASEEDILYEILLKSGFTLTERIKTIDLTGKKIYDINDNSLLICLEDEITKELIEAVAEREPLQFICLDRGFHGNDQLKANAVQTFEALNQTKDKEVQIVFKTV